MPEITHLLWIDLETTGTDESLDCILEVGAILTDVDLNNIGEFSQVVQPTHMGISRLHRNPVVLQMHKANGLYDVIMEQRDELPNVQTVDLDLMARIKEQGVANHSLMIAGSGVSHFDRRFVKAQMVQTDRLLAYPAMDIGVVRRAWQMFTGEPSPATLPQEGKTHRAMDDVRQHLQEATAFRDLWNTLIAVDYSNSQG